MQSGRSGAGRSERRNPYVKQLVLENCRPAKISHLHFGFLSDIDMMQLSEVRIFSVERFVSRPDARAGSRGRLVHAPGRLDQARHVRYVSPSARGLCRSLRYIRLALPVFHIGRVLLPPSDRATFLRRFRDPRTDDLRCLSLRKQIPRVHISPYCSAVNGSVRKLTTTTLKVAHDKYRAKATQDLRNVFIAHIAAAQAANPELGAHLAKTQDDLSPLVVQALFCAIREQHCPLLWMDAVGWRPENLLLSTVLVPPVCIRPSVAMDGGIGTNEDDVTIKLQEVVQVNSALAAELDKGASLKMVMEDWDFLQLQVAQLMNGETPGVSKLPGGGGSPGAAKPLRGYRKRLKGKQDRFRGNLSGKRVDFSGRTVISPDPHLQGSGIRVPIISPRRP
ncbi:hypothetical protein PsorP6_006466 [Peronosclerospora sorghi]|uniref:Uncharacterized protein n=1 Tax=Peronosclerospora sorghi TaxID=230839 RepID=A0ACC0W6Y3_9STRA|nr:hypothetical protein PsorP6_006466 [Peronosclerospora sorghi]